MHGAAWWFLNFFKQVTCPVARVLPGVTFELMFASRTLRDRAPRRSRGNVNAMRIFPHSTMVPHSHHGLLATVCRTLREEPAKCRREACASQCAGEVDHIVRDPADAGDRASRTAAA